MRTITDTAVVNKSYSSRGLIVHGSTTPSAVRAANGTLWVGVREQHLMGTINLYRSQDNGFSWENIFRGSWPTGLGWGGVSSIHEGERANGPFVSLTLIEDLNRIILWNSFYYSAENENRVWPFMFHSQTGERILDNEIPSNNPGWRVGADDLAVKVVNNDNAIFIVYSASGRIRIRTFYPNQITLPKDDRGSGPNNYISTFDASPRQDGHVDIAATTSNETIHYLRYNDLNGSFTSPTTIVSGGNKKHDVAIARDGYGRLVITWSEIMGGGVQVRYAFSSDGNTWTTHNVPINYPYFDAVLGEGAGRTNVIAGLDGFVITYVADVNGVPRTYVRTVGPNQLGEEREVARYSNPEVPVVGAKFFKPASARKLDLSEPGNLRVAYQVNEGNSATGNDSKPVRFGQEPLSESVYPPLENIHTNPYQLDSPDGSQRLVKVNVVAGPSSNIDYYEQGVIGRHTRRHIAAFKRVGTHLRLRRYEPNRDAEMDDKSAYAPPEEFTSYAVVTPMSYETPFAATNDDFTTFIERDARRIHLPADFHLERSFILNKGNFLKRTVWTFFFDGNEYEISQVVPHFMKGQLVHYSANAYVVGVSNDPFSRKTIPSET